jgi:hypothetical protein
MEKRKVNCEVAKPVADKIKEWANAHNVDCFRSECYDNIYVEMTLTETEIEEVDELIDELYDRLLECECSICGGKGSYLMDESEKETYIEYCFRGREMGLLQNVFPKIPAWIRSGAIDKYSGGFCICPKCMESEKEA